MKTLLRWFTLSLLFSAAAFPLRAAADSRVYELRTYTATPGNLDKVLARFRDHTCKLFEQHGMENIAYWVPLDEKDGAGGKLVYLLAHKSREAAKASWDAFQKDPEWVKVRNASEANGKIVEKVDSVFLGPTDYSPSIAPSTAAAPRVFELRMYTAAEGKLAALDARYRDHTRALFAKHGITDLGYWHPLDADKGAANTLYFLFVYDKRESAAALWDGFGHDSEWTKVKAESEKGGKLTMAASVVFLAPTDFSPLK
jgi:NIPSNAP